MTLKCQVIKNVIARGTSNNNEQSKNTKLKYHSPNESSVTQKQCLALYHSFTYAHLMKQKVISLTAGSFVCRCHWMYLLVLRATSGVLHSAGME